MQPRPEDINVLIGCETSGMMRDAFLALGFNAFSCDTDPADTPTNRHIRDDIRAVMHDPMWDVLCVMHPPCTRLCNSGVRWLTTPPKTVPDAATDLERQTWGQMTDDQRRAIMWRLLDEGAALFSDCWNAPIPMRAIENPVMHRHAKARIANFRPAAQTVQPWWFGDPAFKGTSFFLHDLPPLIPTHKLTPPAKGTEDHKRWSAIHRASPAKNRAKVRSKTFPGIAAAAARQWGDAALKHKEPA